MSDDTKWRERAEKAEEYVERLRTILAPIKKQIDSIALYQARDRSLGHQESVYADWSTWFALSVLLAGTGAPSLRDWLPHEAAIERHLVQRLQEWREAGWPPAQIYFTSGLERLVAALIEHERVPMPTWFRMRLAEDAVFAERFYRELAETLADAEAGAMK